MNVGLEGAATHTLVVAPLACAYAPDLGECYRRAFVVGVGVSHWCSLMVAGARWSWAMHGPRAGRVPAGHGMAIGGAAGRSARGGRRWLVRRRGPCSRGSR